MADSGPELSLPNNRLFVLGAGFSKLAGLPLGHELLEEVRIRIRDHHRIYNWDGPLEKEIREWKELYPDNELSLESVFAYSHRKHFLQLIGADEHFSHGSRSIVFARKAIQSILIESTPIDAPPPYSDFASRLTPNDTVITLNYDTLLEEVLESAEIPYSLTPEWWLDNEQAENPKRFSKPQYVEVLKLHGSIDWYDRNYYLQSRAYADNNPMEVPDEDPLFGPNRTVPTEALSRGKVAGVHGEEILSRVYRVPNHRQHFPVTPKHYMVVPFLLPPAYDKLLGNDPIRDIWRDLHRSFETYSSITFIGYSMPKYDEYAYEAFGRLILGFQHGSDTTYFGHRRVPVQVVTLAESPKDLFSDWRFLKPDKTRIWTDGFSADALNWIDWGD